MLVLGTEFAIAVRSETVDGLGALLEWLKKVFLLVLSNPEGIPLMLWCFVETQALISYLHHVFLW